MGLPDPGFYLGTGKLGFLQPQRRQILLVYAGGIAVFSLCLFRLTEPHLYGGSWLWTLALQNNNDGGLIQAGAGTAGASAID
jgi:hypothetical protein